MISLLNNEPLMFFCGASFFLVVGLSNLSVTFLNNKAIVLAVADPGFPVGGAWTS